MKPIVIYGPAVQEARNRIRSAQISTMFDVIRMSVFADADDDRAKQGALSLARAISQIPAPVGNPKAAAALNAAKTRASQFILGGEIADVFALADALRWLGEYIELGGGGDAIKAFEKELHNPAAFSSANRARRPVPDYNVEELPDLGIFKNRLLDRSVLKYMERFYGPYLGADISGTTTDSVAALAYLLAVSRQQEINQGNLQTAVDQIVEAGAEVIPIASMVLQYHHSLMETGLALARTSPAMATQADQENSVLPGFDFYDFTSLVKGQGSTDVYDALSAGNRTLASELKGHGLVILRDFIDIEQNDFADVEIALLVPDPKGAQLFGLGRTYDDFAGQRSRQMITDELFYRRGDPSLAAIASEYAVLIGLSEQEIGQLVRMNSLQLGAAGYFQDLDRALQGVQGPDLQLEASKADPGARAETGTSRETGAQKSASPGPRPSLPSFALPAPNLSKGKARKSGSSDMPDVLKRLDPKALLALEKLMGRL